MSKIEVMIGGHTFEIDVLLSQRTATEVPLVVNGQPITVSVPDLDAPIDQMDWLLIDVRPHEVVIDPDLRSAVTAVSSRRFRVVSRTSSSRLAIGWRRAIRC
jgi:hypothetical protein